MDRRKVMITTVAAFTIGVAFAAQPTSPLADRSSGGIAGFDPWLPGINMVMSAREPNVAALPPR